MLMLCSHSFCMLPSGTFVSVSKKACATKLFNKNMRTPLSLLSYVRANLEKITNFLKMPLCHRVRFIPFCICNESFDCSKIHQYFCTNVDFCIFLYVRVHVSV